jgi:hypothetical protein
MYLAVLVEGGGADAVQLAAGQHRLEHVAGVHGALGLAGADDGVQLVDEEDDAPVALLDLLEHGLEALLKLAAVLGARDERAHVEGEEALVLEASGTSPRTMRCGQALGDGGLAHARLADEHRVVLGLAGEDADDVADLLVAADDRVELLLRAELDEVLAVFLEHVVGASGLSVVTRWLPRRDEPVFLPQKRREQVDLLDLLVAVFHGQLLGSLHRLHGFLRILLCIHGMHLLV